MHDQALAEPRQEEKPLQCGLCGCKWEDPKPVEGRKGVYYCDPAQSGCERLTRPEPRTESERLEFERWQNRDREEAKILWSFHIDRRLRGEVREDAIYRIQKHADGGYSETAVIAMPFAIDRVVRVEGTLRMDTNGPEQISGTFDEIKTALRRMGWILEPRYADMVLAHLGQEARRRHGIKEGRETFEIYVDENGQLTYPTRAFPKPGQQAEEWAKLAELLEHEATKDEWKAFADLETHYAPKEVLPAKAMCAMAPFARLLRSQRFIVPSPYHLSTNSGSGKSKCAEAFSTHAWATKDIPAADLNSDFRFAYYLSGAGTTLTVQEAEKFDWARQAATIKNSLESDMVASRGTKDLAMVSYPSRRVLIFTSNQLPALGGPTLARLLVIRFDEDRAKISSNQQDSFDAAMGRLGAVGPALVRAAVKRWRTPDALYKAIRERAEAIEKAYGARFRDNRRARCWALVHVFLEVWEAASGGIHKTPKLEAFVQDVVRPVEIDTFAAQQDRLGAFRAWFDRYRAERSRIHEGEMVVAGQDEIWAESEWTSEKTKRTYRGHLVTRAVTDAYNAQARATPGAGIESLAELARLVTEAYSVPKDAFVDAKGVPRSHGFALGGKKRAVWVPTPEPDEMNDLESGVE